MISQFTDWLSDWWDTAKAAVGYDDNSDTAEDIEWYSWSSMVGDTALGWIDALNFGVVKPLW